MKYSLDATDPNSIRSFTRSAVKRRYFAASLDNLIAIILFLSAASSLGDDAGPLAVAVGVVVFLAYFFLFELMFSRTPGKMIFGLVVAKLGDNLKPVDVGIRTIFRLLEVNPALLGALPAILSILFSKSNQRFGDRYAKTVVVSKNAID